MLEFLKIQEEKPRWTLMRRQWDVQQQQQQQRWCLFRSSMFEFSDYDNVSVTGRQSATSTLNREIDAPDIELAGYLERKKKLWLVQK